MTPTEATRASFMKRVIVAAILLLTGVSPGHAGFKDGVDAYKRGDYEVAFKEFQALANEGNVRAQHTLGYMYEKGRGVDQDLLAAVSWYRRAADQGDALAQYNLAIMYYTGKGVLRNYTEAAQLFRKAAEQGYSQALYNMGEIYRQGQGVLRDAVQAHMWYTLAAAHGDPLAAEARDKIARQMRPAQITRSEADAQAWLEQHRR